MGLTPPLNGKSKRKAAGFFPVPGHSGMTAKDNAGAASSAPATYPCMPENQREAGNGPGAAEANLWLFGFGLFMEEALFGFFWFGGALFLQANDSPFDLCSFYQLLLAINGILTVLSRMPGILNRPGAVFFQKNTSLAYLLDNGLLR